MRKKYISLGLLASLLLAMACYASTNTIGWDYTDVGQTGFQILRCTASAGGTCTPASALGVTPGASARQVADTTAATNASYCYAVVALGAVNSPPTAALCLNTPAKLAFTRQPQAVTVGQPLPDVQVEIEDSTGAALPLVTTTSIALALSANPTSATLSGSTSQATSGGQSAFPGLSLNVVGTGTTLQATSPNLISATSAVVSTLPSGVDIATDLVAYYKLDEASGLATDQTSNANHGTLTASPTRVAGLYGNGLSFGGGAQRLVIPASSSLNNLPGLTWSAWVFPRSLTISPSPRLVDKQSTAATGWSIYMTPTALGVSMDYSTTRMFQEVPISGAALNSWHHWMVVWNGQSQASSVQVYLDGVPLTPSLLTNGAGSRVADTSNALIVGNRTEGDRGSDMILDEVRVYRRALRPIDTAALYPVTGNGILAKMIPVFNLGS